MNEKKIRVKSFVFTAIIAVVALSLISMGVAQYISEVNIKEKQIIEKSKISLQPILTLAKRNINGANKMNLKNTAAKDLYKTNSALLYLKMSGTSAGSPKTDFFEAIPPAFIEHDYSAKGLNEERLKAILKEAMKVVDNTFLIDRSEWVLIIKEKLNLKNGGTVLAVFSAKELAGIGWEVFKKVLLASFIVLFGAVIIAIFVGSRVAKPIDEYIDNINTYKNNLDVFLRKVSDVTSSVDKYGDLTKRLPAESDEKLGELAEQINAFLNNMHDVIGAVQEATMSVNSSASEISAAVEEQAAITTQQSTSVSEITSTMEELSATSTQIADNSQSVVEISESALKTAENGSISVKAITVKMEEISNDNENSIKQIVDLGKKSKEISKVMEIINNIADQTKLIAFNAAIEASSAGEAGKRFGVVAVEIRRLADNVMESTSEIESRIEEIQDAVNRLVIASEKSSKRVLEGNKLSSQTVEILNNILAGAQSTTTSAKQISLSTQQQKSASNQVVTSLKEISEGAKQASASIKQTSTTTGDLTNLSNDLKSLVGKFKLNGSDG